MTAILLDTPHRCPSHEESMWPSVENRRLMCKPTGPAGGPTRPPPSRHTHQSQNRSETVFAVLIPGWIPGPLPI